MTRPFPHRIRWAIEGLDLSPGQRVLEIGCGNGMSCMPICERIDAGCYFGVDRSDKMIAAARDRNAAWAERGTASFQCRDATSLDDPDARFDRILAINVNLFWRQADAALERLCPLLAPAGRLHLVFEPPDVAQLDAIARACADGLLRHSFGAVAIRQEGRCLELRVGPG